MLRLCRPVQGCDRHGHTSKRFNLFRLYCLNHNYSVQVLSWRQLLDSCRRQLKRRSTTTSSSAAVPPKSPSAIARSLRDIAKGLALYRDQKLRASLDDQVDALATQFRSTTADGSLASSRDLGSIVWSLAKLSTPCCASHAVVLLRALTSPSTTSTPFSSSLQSASNQTLCKALYAAALLSRDFCSTTHDRHGSGSPAAPHPSWLALLGPARALAAACVPRLSSFNMQDTSNAWWAVATLSSLSYSSVTVADTTVTATIQKQQRLRQQRLASEPQTHQHEEQLLSFPGAAEGSADVEGSRETFSPPAGLLEGLAAAAERHMRSPEGCSSQGLANMLWGACRLGYVDERMLAAAVAHIKPQVRSLVSMDPRAFASCLWALASLRYPAAVGLLSTASRPAASHVRTFDDQSLSNLLWAYGMSGVVAPRLFAAAAEEIARRADWMPLQFLAICLWAFATANYLDYNMMAAVAGSLTGLSSPASSWSTAAKRARRGGQDKRVDSLHSSAALPPAPTLGHSAKAAAETETEAAAEAALLQRLEACQGRRTQAIGNLAWAYAALGARHDPLVSALAGQAAAAAPALNAQELSNVLYSIARLAPNMMDKNPNVLKVLFQEVDRRVEQAQFGSGFNRFNRRSTNTPYSSLAGSSGLRPSQKLNPRDLAMLSWSLAILAPSNPTLHRILRAAAAVPNTDNNNGATASLKTPSADVNEGADGDAAGSVEPEELQTQQYNLYGLVQLYAANYATCLAAAAAAAAPSAESKDTVDSDLHDLILPNRPAARRNESETDGCNGGGAALAALVQAAAAAMRQAQSAAEAIGAGYPASAQSQGTSNHASNRTEEGAAAVARQEGSSSRQGCDEMVRFGPLGTCRALFRACRDAWFLNTASTNPSELQAAVASVLQNQREPPVAGAIAAVSSDSSGSGSSRTKHQHKHQPRKLLVAEEALSPDRMLRVDLLVHYKGCLVLLEVDGPSHYAVELYGGRQVGAAGAANADVDGKASKCRRDGGGAPTQNAVHGSGEEDEDVEWNGCTDDADHEGVHNRLVTAEKLDMNKTRRSRIMTSTPGWWRSRRPLGDTLLRNRFLAASLGLLAADFAAERSDEEDVCLSACTAEVDPWVIGALREQLSSAGTSREEGGQRGNPGLGARQGAAGQPREEEMEMEIEIEIGARADAGGGKEGEFEMADAGIESDGRHGSAASASPASALCSGDGLRGVALATLNYGEWNAAGSNPGDKWARCLEPLLVRASAYGSDA